MSNSGSSSSSSSSSSSTNSHKDCSNINGYDNRRGSLPTAFPVVRLLFLILNIANWSQLPPQTPKSQKVTLTKTPVYLPLHARTAVTNCLKPIPDKPTDIPSRKIQKIIYVARDHDIDPILRENMLALKHVLSLLTRLPPSSFPAVIGPPPLCIQYFKLAPDVMTCAKQTEYHACGCCNRLHKPCLEAWLNGFGYV